MKSPAFRFYPADLWGSPDVQAMDLSEVGAYLSLLSVAWQNERHGYLQDDDSKLRRWARMTPEQWQQSRDVLLSKFPTVEDGWRANPRMVAEAEKQATFSESQRAKANKKWGNVPEVPTECQEDAGKMPGDIEQDAGAMPSVSVSVSAFADDEEKDISVPSEPHPDALLSGDNAKGPQLVSVNPKRSRKRKTELGPENSYDPQFLAVFERFPKQVEKSASEDQWAKAVRRLQRGEKDKPRMGEAAAIAYLKDAAEDYAKKVCDTEAQFIRSMRTWLRDKIYLDYDPKAKVEYVEVDPAKWWEGGGAHHG
jgi:uncharacterized protein YdaU (DUF1376 family)